MNCKDIIARIDRFDGRQDRFDKRQMRVEVILWALAIKMGADIIPIVSAIIK